MPSPHDRAVALAHAILAVPRTFDLVACTIRQHFKRIHPRDSREIAGHVLRHLDHHGLLPPARELARLLVETKAFRRLCRASLRRQKPLGIRPRAPAFAPTPQFENLPLPPIATPGELAEFLSVSLSELDWLADTRRSSGKTHIPILQNHTYYFRPRRSGSPRLIEAPKSQLKTAQRHLLSTLFSHIPIHDAAHGFAPGRSCVGAASKHAGEYVVLTLDLKDFFLTTPVPRIHRLLLRLGYPLAVARLLVGLCTTMTPASVFRRLPPLQRYTKRDQNLFVRPHLAQGAPTSPALANIAAFGLDQRLSKLSASFGGNYTRYADDLTFSGDEVFARRLSKFQQIVEAIIRDQGYEPNGSKTRIRFSSQRQIVTGVVVNRHVNVPRDAFDILKATLHNCRRNGPETENRSGHANFRGHLDGRIGWVEQLNPHRGRKLRAMFDAVNWDG